VEKAGEEEASRKSGAHSINPGATHAPRGEARMMPCPRCGTNLETLWIESDDGYGKTVEMIRRCPRCGYREVVEVLRIRRRERSVVVERGLLPA